MKLYTFFFLFQLDDICDKLETDHGFPCDLEEEPPARKKRALRALAKHTLVRQLYSYMQPIANGPNLEKMNASTYSPGEDTNELC